MECVSIRRIVMTMVKVGFMLGLIALLGAGRVSGGIISFDPFYVGAGGYTNDVVMQNQGPVGSPIVGFTGKWESNTSLIKTSTTTIDASSVLESGGTIRIPGWGDTYTRTAYRSFTAQSCSGGDTNYWSVVISYDGQDSNDDVYATWRCTANSQMALNLGIINGRLAARLRESTTLDLGSYTPGQAYHLVVQAVIGSGAGLEDTTVWVNPTRNDIMNGVNAVTNYANISFISPGVEHNRAEVTTSELDYGKTVFLDEILYTTDAADIKFQLTQEMRGAEFDPALKACIAGPYEHNNTNAMELKSITLPSGRYTNLEGPVYAVTAGTSYYRTPGTAFVANRAGALKGLNAGAVGVELGDDDRVMFDSPVTNSSDSGFFIIDMDWGDTCVICPLDASTNKIAGWALHINNSEFGAELATLRSVMYSGGGSTQMGDYRAFTGVSFTRNDFTNGSPDVLTDDVHGLSIDGYVGGTRLDVSVVGIYRGPTVARVQGSASKMTGATFDKIVDNPMTNDFAVTGVSSVDTPVIYGISGAQTVYQHGPLYDSANIIYPAGGVSPGSGYAGATNSMAGLDVNGTSGAYIINSEFMFDKPLRNDKDGFFVIELQGNDTITILPLDSDRTPISTYSIEVAASDWGGDLANIEWTGHSYFIGKEFTIAGIMMTLSDFAGGTGELAGKVHGIRIEDPNGGLDVQVVGSFIGTPIQGTVILVR